jgi:hypothetical protein
VQQLDAAAGDFPSVAILIGGLNAFCTSSCFSLIGVLLPFRRNIQLHLRKKERRKERKKNLENECKNWMLKDSDDLV